MSSNQLIEAHAVTEEVWMVPCLIKREENFFQPLCKPFSIEIDWQRLHARHNWTPREDESLLKLISQLGPSAWTQIAKELNDDVHCGLPIRQAKQCRDRFINHLNPELKKDNWTPQEDLRVLKKQRKMGNKWSKIARFFNGRTENQIKNRFNSLVKKAHPQDPILFVSQNQT